MYKPDNYNNKQNVEPKFSKTKTIPSKSFYLSSFPRCNKQQANFSFHFIGDFSGKCRESKNTNHVSVLGGPGQADEPADRVERRRARAEVHGEVLHPRPQPAGGGVHQVPVLPPDQERPRHRPSSVQRQHLSSDGVIHCPG